MGRQMTQFHKPALLRQLGLKKEGLIINRQTYTFSSCCPDIIVAISLLVFSGRTKVSLSDAISALAPRVRFLL